MTQSYCWHLFQKYLRCYVSDVVCHVWTKTGLGLAERRPVCITVADFWREVTRYNARVVSDSHLTYSWQAKQTIFVQRVIGQIRLVQVRWVRIPTAIQVVYNRVLQNLKMNTFAFFLHIHISIFVHLQIFLKNFDYTLQMSFIWTTCENVINGWVEVCELTSWFAMMFLNWNVLDETMPNETSDSKATKYALLSITLNL